MLLASGGSPIFCICAEAAVAKSSAAATPAIGCDFMRFPPRSLCLLRSICRFENGARVLRHHRPRHGNGERRDFGGGTGDTVLLESHVAQALRDREGGEHVGDG